MTLVKTCHQIIFLFFLGWFCGSYKLQIWNYKNVRLKYNSKCLGTLQYFQVFKHCHKVLYHGCLLEVFIYLLRLYKFVIFFLLQHVKPQCLCQYLINYYLWAAIGAPCKLHFVSIVRNLILSLSVIIFCMRTSSLLWNVAILTLIAKHATVWHTC